MLKAVPPCLALALVAFPAWAQFPAGPEFQVNTYTTGNQFSARVSADAAGRFVVVWQSTQNDAGDIYARRYDSTGSPVGGDFRVNSGGGYDVAPAVAMARTGEFVVVWQGAGYSGAAIKGQRYDALGNPAGAEFHVNAYITNWQLDPAVAVDANGNFVVVWASTLQDGSHNGVFGRRFDAVGTPIGLDFAVNSYTTGRQDKPRLAMDAAGGFVVVWHSDPQDGTSYDVFGQRFSAVATPLGGEFQVNVATYGIQRFPAVAAGAAGEFVVVWDGPSAYTNGILARRFAASGVPAGGEFLVNQQTANVTEWSAVAGDAAGNFLVSWAVDAQDGDTRGVFARPYDPWGNPLAPEFQVNTFTTGFQSLPSVALGRHGDAVVAWTSLGQDAPSSAGVFGQRYSDVIFGDGFDAVTGP